MKNNILLNIVNHISEGKSTLNAVKEAFATYFAKKSPIEVDVKEVISPLAFTVDELDFDNFTNLVGFTHFHASSEAWRKENDIDQIDEDELHEILDGLSADSMKFLKGTVSEFTQQLFEELTAILNSMGHKVQTIEIKGDPEEIARQFGELQGEAGQ